MQIILTKYLFNAFRRIMRRIPKITFTGELYMKATGIVRRIDELGRVVIPKEIRRTMRIREGDPTLTTLTPVARFLYSIMDISKRIGVDHED